MIAEWLIWLIVVCVSAIAEFVSMQMVGIWLVAGGLIALILALIGVPFWVQLIVFIIISMALLLSFRKLCMKFLLKNTNEKTNIDSIVGKEYKLLEDITAEQCGSVKMNGVVWTAIAENDDISIKAGTMVMVKEVKGNKLVVAIKGE